MKIESREYKLLIDHTLFRHREEAVSAIWTDIRHAARQLPSVRVKGDLKPDGSRFVRFLDTPDFTFRRNDLLLRQRWGPGKSDLTLKCRSSDLFLALGSDVRPADGFEAETKFEEDIAPPFLCRFSHSATIEGPNPGKSGKPPEVPDSVDAARDVFPVIGRLQHDNRRLHPKVEIRTVHNIVVNESVWKSDTIVFDSEEKSKPFEASFAIILWTRGSNDAPVIAELSFKIKTDDGNLTRDEAAGAHSFYVALQSLDSFRSDARTKTEYIYRDGGRD